MNAGRRDGSAGDADYGAIGGGYAAYRAPEPAIEQAIRAALGQARKVVNVGAGAGSYEPTEGRVVAVEPSATMRAQRAADAAPAVAAVAGALPFADGAFDAAMAIFTVHQWPDLEVGLAEMRRVAARIVIPTADPAALTRLWLPDYAPEVAAVEAGRYPPIHRLLAALPGARVEGVPIPLDCRDGFNEAYYGRPERLLDPGARKACSSWSMVAPAVIERFVRDLSRDLADGSWDRRFGAWRTTPAFDGPLRLVVA